MLVVAHRTPTSVPGCRRLADAGAAVFEMDVKVSRRGVSVTHYLPALGVPKWFEHDNWSVRWHSRARHDPLLCELAEAVPSECRILLDPKETTSRGRRLLAEQVAHVATDRDRFVVSTADPEDLARYRRAGFCTWRTVKTRRELDAILSAGRLPDAGLSVRHTLLDAERIVALHRLSSCVVAWTVNNSSRADWLAGVGVDGVTTDRVEVLQAMASR